ncbi:MAG: sigma 54-interacting transcriptional regulator [Planctomycetota bacterium]
MTLGTFLARLCEETPDRRLLAAALDGVAAALDSERVFLFQLRAGGGFRVLAGRSRHGEMLAASSSRLSHFAVRRMLAEGGVVFVPDARRDRRYRPEEVLEGRRAPVSIVVVPVKAAGSPAAGIYADHRFHPLKLDRARVERAREWASAIGLALRIRASARGRRRAERTPAGRSRPGALSRREKVPPGRAAEPVSFHGLVSANPDMKDIFDALSKLRGSDLPVLISGETGTGKSLLAAAVHASSSRSAGPFVSLSLASLPESLIESELMGYARGAFTGAEADKPGLFVQADGGTLHLEEVADAGPELQKKLLRVLEDGLVRPLGAKAPVRVDVRLVASTSRDLERLVRGGQFRKDLYYRLKGVVFEIPPLRERREDILLLAGRFLEEHAAREGREPPVLAESARARLLEHAWPGNVRELENAIRRLVALGPKSVDGADLAPVLGARGRGKGAAPAGPRDTLGEVLELAEREAVEAALRAAGGNKAEAARSLGISRKALYRRLERYRRA